MFICEPECLSACMVYAPCAFLMLVEVRRGVLFPGTGVMWVLGIDPGSSVGAPSSINHRAISPALWPYFFVAETFSTWGSLMWLGWRANELQGSICLCGTGTGVPGRLFQVFNVGAGDANLGPVACAANISLTEPSSWSYFQDPKRCSHVGYLVLRVASK